MVLKAGKVIAILVTLTVVGIFGARKLGTMRETSSPGQVQDGGYWVQDMDGWKPKGTPPECPNPLRLASFVDVDLATSVLYPGQRRSVGYEPTAGYRFDGLPNEKIVITVPIEGEVVQAARFLVGEEIQYVFDILSPCGIMVRLDHLLTLAPKFQEIAERLPAPKEGDSRSTSVFPRVKVVTGEVVATAVGLRKNKNTFASFTVFDFRQKNQISQNETWAKEHPNLDHYVICPYPYLPEDDFERIKALPAADSMSGSRSDFCEKF